MHSCCFILNFSQLILYSLLPLGISICSAHCGTLYCYLHFFFKEPLLVSHRYYSRSTKLYMLKDSSSFNLKGNIRPDSFCNADCLENMTSNFLQSEVCKCLISIHYSEQKPCYSISILFFKIMGGYQSFKFTIQG